jgi:hypothetical protein
VKYHATAVHVLALARSIDLGWYTVSMRHRRFKVMHRRLHAMLVTIGHWQAAAMPLTNEIDQVQ